MRNKIHVLKNIRNSLETGGTLYNACKMGGVNHVTLWRWRKQHKRIDKYIETLLEGRTQMVEDALYKAAVGGNVTAQMFWLKNRGSNWKDTPLIDTSKHTHLTLIAELHDLAKKGLISGVKPNHSGSSKPDR